jgi:hypothetical protein
MVGAQSNDLINTHLKNTHELVQFLIQKKANTSAMYMH